MSSVTSRPGLPSEEGPARSRSRGVSARPESPTVEAVSDDEGTPAVTQGRTDRAIEERDVLVNALVLERAAADAVAAVAGAGIPCIVLKGPLQQRWLAPGGPARPSRDVDIIVPPQQHEAAGEALRTIGYEPKEAVPEEPGREHAFVWVAPRRVPVEVHFSLVGADRAKVWDVLSRESETVTVMGQ